MLALAEMQVVIALAEKITLGIEESITAKENLSLRIWLDFLRCHSDEVKGKLLSGTLVNPASEKPKFGKGNSKEEMNSALYVHA